MTRAALLLAALAAAAAPAPRPAGPELVSIRTRDGWTLAADYRAPRGGGVVLVLAHGVGSSRGEWAEFAARLANAGVGTLCVDLRGHHDSRKGPTGTRDYRSFGPRDWAKAVEDLDAGARWLQARGVPAGRVAFGGASIGANLASQAARRDLKAPFLLLLSPGPDYRGVRLEMRSGLWALAGAAVNDPYAHQTLGQLSTMGKVATFEVAVGHGVQMFDDKAVLEKAAVWVTDRARAASANHAAPKK